MICTSSLYDFESYGVDIGAMGVVMVEDVIISLKNHHEFVTFGGFNVVFCGLGVAVYAFEGVGMALPLESETQENEKFGKILGLSMGFISLMYATFGVLGYFAFGDATKDIITTNLGKGLVSYLVQLGLCINLFFTFPLMMNPVYEVFERRFSNGNYCLWLRWVMVLGVKLVALMVPNFADFLHHLYSRNGQLLTFNNVTVHTDSATHGAVHFYFGGFYGMTFTTYVVYRGRQSGVYLSWQACLSAVSGCSGACYKGFRSVTEAEEAYALWVRSEAARQDSEKFNNNEDVKDNDHVFDDEAGPSNYQRNDTQGNNDPWAVTRDLINTLITIIIILVVLFIFKFLVE